VPLANGAWRPWGALFLPWSGHGAGAREREGGESGRAGRAVLASGPEVRRRPVKVRKDFPISFAMNFSNIRFQIPF
jgi:hypothetical protein